MTRIANALAPALLATLVTAISSGVVSGQSDSSLIPENAHAETYGSGWECDRGYAETDGACTPIQVPANAYLTNSSYGRGWDCKRGFRENRSTCIPFEVPANAYLNASGNGWKCHRGYQNARNACKAVEVPENGYLNDTSYGTGWSCDRGFTPVGRACEPLKLPPNTHLDFSGNRWECDPPLLRRNDECVTP